MTSTFGLGVLVIVGLLALSFPAVTSTSFIDNIGSNSKQHANGQPPDYYLYVDEEATLPKVNSLDDDDEAAAVEPDLEVHPRWKRDTGEPSWKVAGAGLTRTFKRLVAESKRIPPSIKLAIEHGNFSNVTEKDIEATDPTLLEYVPPEKFATMIPAVKSKLIDIFLATNRAHALSNLLGATAKQIDAESLLPKIRLKHGRRGQEPPNEAESILIYTAASRKLGNNTTDQVTISTLQAAGVLEYVPEELFIKTQSEDAARTLLTTLYRKPLDAETNNVDDKALIYRLIEVGYGSAKNITSNKFDNLLPKFYATLPAAYIKNLPHDLVKSKISTFKTAAFGTTLQRKAVADSYLASFGVETNTIEGATSLTKQQGVPKAINLQGVVNDLDSLAAFVNPSLTQDQTILRRIVSGCNDLNLPAPVKTIHYLIKQQLRGSKQVANLNRYDIEALNESVCVYSPPSIIRQAIASNAFTRRTLENFSHKVEHSASSSYLKGLVQQLSKFAFDQVRNQFLALPPAFLNAIGVGNLLKADSSTLRDILEKLNKSQDSLDEVQKGVLIRRLQSYGVLDLEQEQSVVPPAIAALLPRAKGQRKIIPSIVSGLPSESDLRLAFGEQRKNLRAQDLMDEPLFVGTLTPSQVRSFHLDDIPAVLSTIRKSTDGPTSHTLKVLSERFAEYIRNKTDDKDSGDKKLLKYLSAAEISRLPATVLAYFMDSRHVRRLPDDVRKEIMIALGTLSTKDHALIPSRTREEIVVQGLEALDKILPDRNKYDVSVVAMIAHGVVDLPADRIRRLTPVALELALDVVQGNVDDDDDGLRQRACLKPEQKQAWRNKIIETYGTPNTWTHGTVTALCCSLAILDEHDLRQIAKENLVTCKCISDDRPPSHLKNLRQALNGACAFELGRPDSSLFTLNKVQAEAGLDIEDIEEQAVQRGGHHGRRGRRHRTRRDGGYSVLTQEGAEQEEDPKPLRCTTLRLVGSAAEYSVETVNTFWEKEIEDCLYELGVEPLSIEAARTLWTKLVNMHDKNVRRISSFTLRKAGYILRGITKGEIDQLDFNDDDIVAPFGVNLGLPKILLEHMAAHLEHAKNKRWEAFTAHDLIVAGNIICGADVERLTRLDATAFRNALPHLKSLHQDCEMTRLGVLANIATNPSVFGDPIQWSAADIRGLGIIFKGLTSKEVAKLQPEAFLGLSPSVAANLVPETLRVLTADQVSHIPRFSALAMRSEQINTLAPAARDHLETNKRGSLVSGTSVNKVQIETVWTLLTLGLTILFAQRVL